MPYIGNIPAESYSQVSYQDLTGGSGTSFTLDYAVGSAGEIEVFVNNVRQEPTVAYTVSGTSLTMTGSIAATDDFYVVFQGKAQQTIGIPEKQTDGTYLFPDDVTVSGNITSTGIDVTGTITPSGGVYLGGTGSANLISDYEFGSWSPFWSDASGNAIFNATPSVNMARYEKIGNMVTCWTYFNMGSGFGTTGSYSASGALYVSGLPFTADGDGSGGSANYYTGSVGWYNSWNNYDGSSVGLGPMCYTVTGTTRLILEYPSNNNTSAIVQSNVNSNNSAIIFNIVYQTSS